MTDPFTQYQHLYGRWCSWETEVHCKDGTTFTRTEYGIILPDHEAASEDLLTVMELMPDQVAIDYDVDPDTITIVDDAPPAWTPTGQPPAGEWQTAKVKIIPNENSRYDRERNVITGDAVADPDHEPRSSHDIRRWIGEWEQVRKEQP